MHELVQDHSIVQDALTSPATNGKEQDKTANFDW